MCTVPINSALPRSLQPLMAPYRSGAPDDVHRDVLWLLCSGFTYLEIADRIGRCEKDVQYHASAWRRHLGVRGISNRLDWTALPFEELMESGEM